MGFRIEEELWEQFLRLVEESDMSAQDVLRELVRTCVESNSTVVKPLLDERSGRERSNELRLRDTIQQLRGYMSQKNYSEAESKFYDITREMKRVRDLGLLEEAQAVAAAFLGWIDEYRLRTGGYKPDTF